jgi:alpha galactosidase A-like protein/alpha galactosidase C-like protein/alpha-galactosidase-like CBM13-containing protein
MRESGSKVGMLNELGLLLVLAGAAVCGAAVLQAQSGARLVPIPLPPMGWSSWNSFSNTVDSQVVMDQAKAMVSTGMAKAGYRYINIDEGWWLGERDAEGNIVVDAKAWPALAAGDHAGDMANIVRYIHGLGLKAGIYTDAGTDGCSTVGPDLGPSYPRTGSEGHYEQDFLQFARWGFDYVKVDWCGGDRENLDPAIQYAEVARAIFRAEAITGRRLYYSICNWGKDSPWTWAPHIGGVSGDIWRTGGDIVAPIVANTKNSGRKATLKDIFREYDAAAHPESQHTGAYNDPDMMVVGMQGLTEVENRVHMSLWAMLGGPLIVGADLTKLSTESLAALTNPAVIAVDQDGLGLQAVKVGELGPGLEVWSKQLSIAGNRAVLLLNRSAVAAPITVRLADLGLVDSSPAAVRDLWSGQKSGVINSSYSATVPGGDAVMLLVQGREGKSAIYTAADAAKLPAGRGGVTLKKGESLSFSHIASGARIARIQIAYTNPDKTPRFAELRVDGRIATRIAFPPTGSSEHSGAAPGAVWIESLLDREGSNNELSFAAAGADGPTVEAISVQ